MFTRHEQTFLDKVIFVDVDDTLADTRGAVYQMYKDTTGDDSGDIFTNSKRYVSFCPLWTEDEINRIFSNPNILYSKTKPMPGAKEGIKKLINMGYDVRIVTIHTAEGIPAKQKWIDTHFPELSDKVYYINNVKANKDIFVGLAIIDDDAKNIDSNDSKFPMLLDIYRVYENRKFQRNYFTSWKQLIDIIK